MMLLLQSSGENKMALKIDDSQAPSPTWHHSKRGCDAY